MVRRLILCVVASLIAVSFFGCAATKPNSTMTTNDMPDFILNPPVEKGKIFGSGMAKKQSPQLAKDIADLMAKTEIAKVLGQKIANLTKQFMSEAGIASPEVTELSESVTRSVTDQNLIGATIVKRAAKDGAIYSLAVIDLNDPAVKSYVQQQVTAAFGNKEALLSQFRAKQGFEELDKELEKLSNDSK